jgi:peptidoglycan/LPS O-acetylase OafA/YrhL
LKPRHSFALDVVRASAALAVVVAHGLMYAGSAHAGLLGPAVFFSTLGVEIFFVLSGYLIGPSLFSALRGEIGAGRFWLRRAWRTLPSYYLFLAINVLLWTTISPSRIPSWDYVWLGQSLVSPAATLFFGESWSLAVEEWFYLLAAIVVALICRFASSTVIRDNWFAFWLVLVVVLSPLIRAWITWSNGFSWDDGLRKLTLLRLDAIALGVLVAWWSLRSKRPSISISVFAGGVVAIATGVGYVVWVVMSGQLLVAPSGLLTALLGAFALSLIAVGSVLVVHFAASLTTCVPRGRIAQAFTKLALRSYSLYLCHIPLLLVVDYAFPALRLEGGINLALGLLFWTLASILMASNVYQWFERPILSWRNRVLS